MGVLSKKADVLRDIEQTLGLVPGCTKTMPENALPGMWGLLRDFEFAETKVPNKYKELIGIAVAGATRCRYCQLFHTEIARLHGATDEEIYEACAQAGVTMCISTYLNAIGEDYESFKKETLAIVQHLKGQQVAAGAPEGTEPRPEVRPSV